MAKVIKLHPEDFNAMMDAIKSPPKPNEALRRLMRAESILERMRGISAQPGTPETDADPRNPIAR